MKIYMFEASWYCRTCGEAIAATLSEPDEWEQEHPDSDSHPVAFDSSEGESDTPDHCAECGLFLTRHLTEEGVRYVKDCVADDLCASGSIGLVSRMWMDFYGIEIADCIDEDGWTYTPPITATSELLKIVAMAGRIIGQVHDNPKMSAWDRAYALSRAFSALGETYFKITGKPLEWWQFEPTIASIEEVV